MVWMMKMSCPRTDSFTSTLVSDNNINTSNHCGLEFKKSNRLQYHTISQRHLFWKYETIKLQPHLCLVLDKPQTCPTQRPSVWEKTKAEKGHSCVSWEMMRQLQCRFSFCISQKTHKMIRWRTQVCITTKTMNIRDCVSNLFDTYKQNLAAIMLAKNVFLFVHTV